ncbi:uncharacterized protein LOC122282038 [Carya illinoinensis]|uniref:uncharacterized protein LOC122282038 n=1 Tax=Carya illinoinensis TaxID=32201 RepID=UPI001C71D498|nr:uncharacterized protein LOC122282038 [Carya illinoinensis]
MDRSWMNLPDRLRSPAYAEGVNHFLTLARSHAMGSDRIRCPCRLCSNNLFLPFREVETHLFIKGFNPTYTQWIFHGEEETRPLIDVDSDPDLTDEDEYIDDMDHMLDDVWAGTFHNVPQGSQGDAIPTTSHPAVPETSCKPSFDQLLEDARRPLFTGCTKFSKLSFVVKLLHIKTLGGWSIKSFDQLLNLLRAAFPDAACPSSYEEARSLERGLGFKYHKIHACPNDCILFWKENADKNECPVCKASRWMSTTHGTRVIPQKVLRHFPLVPRLQRLYMSTKISTDMRWHKDQRVTTDTIMRHPADSESWKTFDKDHSWFAGDARNVRLGLASDGFNPFNNLAKPYSIWPVILVLYNLPPWSCMKDQFFMTSLLIPGPKSPGNDIDVYLQPLVDELVELWEHGVPTYDASTKGTFTLHAALMWTINDFPAYGNLSGWSTKGKLACPSCNANTESNWLKFGRKQCYMGHRRFLPPDHIWRSKKGLFNGKEDHRIPPRVLSGSDIVSQLHMVGDVQFGKSRRKRKRTSEELNWTKISIFFKLPYWSTLLIRHNLDVMHIEKNICDNIFGTLLNIPGKTKDNINARRDLEILGMRKELHLRHAGEKFTLPPAMYTLHGDERNKFGEWLAEVKFPDGFASNIARCVSVRDCKISGFKSHDCHVFLQRLLPIAVGGFLRPDIALALTELSSFFKKLCSRTFDITHLSQLQSDIVIILCKLEMIFPPSFFDVMIHLAIHLPREAILGGPVQYRWMYPFERYLGKFKRYVKNKARPEGSIAEAYIHLECLTFCSMYLQDVETKFTRVDRNIDGGGEDTIDGFSIFNQHVRPLGVASNVKLDDKLLSSARWYILNNCVEIQPYIDEHYEKCKLHTPNSCDRMHKNEFPTWFKKRVQDQRIVNPQDVSADLYALACGPDLWVATYSACIINGKRFHSKQHEPWRWTQNSGVVVKGENLPNNLDFYGVINEVLELRYMGGRHVYLFSCDWFDVSDQRRGVRVDVHMTSVNMSRTWYKDEPFVLACQASQCYYVKDLWLKGNWYVVEKFTNRNVYDIPPIPRALGDNDVESSDDDAYQDDVPSYEYAPMHCDDDPVITPLSRTDIEPISIDAPEAMHLGRDDQNTRDLINNEAFAYASEDGYGDGEYSDEEYFSTDEESMSN